MKDLCDNELFSRLKTGSELAFIELYQRYWRVVHAAAYLVLKSDVEAKDVLQEVYREIWEKKEQIEITNSIRNYLTACARNRSLNVVKRKLHYDSIISSFRASHLQPDTPYEITEARDLENSITIAINQIKSGPVRTAFYLHHIKGLPINEIADHLGISIHASQSYISKAKNLLHITLKKNTKF